MSQYSFSVVFRCLDPNGYGLSKFDKLYHARQLMSSLVNHFNVSRGTIIKWRKRDCFNDKSHRPNTLHKALSPVQEEIVVMLRRSLLLTIDDLLVVVREFIDETLTRSSLLRLLTRQGVNRLSQLYAEQSDSHAPAKIKTFKDYEPGYIHVDIKYLPKMPDDLQKRYLLVGIDRATRWVYREIATDKTAKTAAKFLKVLAVKCPVIIKTLLTDNGKELTDRFSTQGEREPTGNQVFEKMCVELNIEHRLIPPKHPQTNGMVERFNGRIAQVIKSTYFACTEEMETTLKRYLMVYNHHVIQRNLGHLTPVQQMKYWQKDKPELFKKRVYDQSGLDI